MVPSIIRAGGKMLYPWVFAPLALSGLSLSAPAQPRTSPRLTPQQMSQGIKKMAQEAVGPTSHFRWITAEHIGFDVIPDAKIFFFRNSDGYNPPTEYTKVMGIEAGDPYGLPIRKQIYVEAVRYQFQGVANKTLSEPHLRQAEGLVLKMIVDIRSTPNRSILRSKLTQREKQINKEFDKLWADTRVYFQRKGFKFEPPEMGDGIEDFFEVRIQTRPANGIVKALPDFTYRVYQLTNRPRNQWRWVTLRADKEKMAGKYRIFVQWPDGRKTEELVAIEQNSTLTFTPSQR
jgi:hypothetical protein